MSEDKPNTPTNTQEVDKTPKPGYKVYTPVNRNEFKCECHITFIITSVYYNHNRMPEELKIRKGHKRMQNIMYAYVHRSTVLQLLPLEYESSVKFYNFMKYSKEDLSDVKDTQSNDINVFLHACRFGYSRHVGALVELDYPEIYNGTFINENGLHIATKHGNIKVVKQILKTNNMRFINSKNDFGESPYDYAVRKGDQQLVQEYIDYFKSLDPSVYQFQIPILQQYNEMNIKPENKFKKGLTNLANKFIKRH